jgi:hypothetical protein
MLVSNRLIFAVNMRFRKDNKIGLSSPDVRSTASPEIRPAQWRPGLRSRDMTIKMQQSGKDLK